MGLPLSVFTVVRRTGLDENIPVFFEMGLSYCFRCFHDRCVLFVFSCFFLQAPFAQLAQLDGHLRAITSLVTTTSNGMLWSSSEDGTIRIWNTANNNCEHIISSEKREEIV